jgi:hypothetical protein
MTTRTELLEAICRRDAIQAELDAAALDVSRKLYALQSETGETHASIAQLLGVKRQRVGQLIARAEKELREAFEREQEDAALVRLSIRRGGKRSGWQGGRVQPRCDSCDHFIATPASRCGRCGHIGGST